MASRNSIEDGEIYYRRRRHVSIHTVLRCMTAAGGFLISFAAADAAVTTIPNTQKISEEAGRINPPPSSVELATATAEVAAISTQVSDWVQGTPVPSAALLESDTYSHVVRLREQTKLFNQSVAELTPPELAYRGVIDLSLGMVGFSVFMLGFGGLAIIGKEK